MGDGEKGPEELRACEEEEYQERVARREERKIRARKEGERSAWFGLGMFGLIGWSVAVPTLAGIALGLWIDTRWPSDYSWTLMLLFAGVVLGCINAWYWLNKEGMT